MRFPVTAHGTTAIIGNVERRRPDGQDGQTPMALLKELPRPGGAGTVPGAGAGHRGGWHHPVRQQGFAEMLGHSAEAVRALKFREIFHTLPAEESAVSVVRAHADLIVELVHEDGSIVAPAWQVRVVARRRPGGVGDVPGPDRAIVGRRAVVSRPPAQRRAALTRAPETRRSRTAIPGSQSPAAAPSTSAPHTAGRRRRRRP